MKKCDEDKFMRKEYLNTCRSKEEKGPTANSLWITQVMDGRGLLVWAKL